jgi:hypothetical protein
LSNKRWIWPSNKYRWMFEIFFQKVKRIGGGEEVRMCGAFLKQMEYCYKCVRYGCCSLGVSGRDETVFVYKNTALSQVSIREGVCYLHLQRNNVC